MTLLQVEGEGHQGSRGAGECLSVPTDPVGGRMQLQTPAAAPLDGSTSCGVSLDSHWLWEGCALSTSIPLLGLGFVSSLVRTRGNETEKHN